MNAALSDFDRSAIGTVLSRPSDPLDHQELQQVLGSTIPLLKLSFLLSEKHCGLRGLSDRGKIQVSLVRPTSLPQTQAP